MGKKKLITSEEDQDSTTTLSSSPKKKHKHKHKKHKRKREVTEEESSVAEDDGVQKKKKHKKKEKEDGSRSLKLKIKLGGQTLATKQVRTPVGLPPPSLPPQPIIEREHAIKNDLKHSIEPWEEEMKVVESVKENKETEDREEEAWLDALEAGELDDFGRMRQEKNTSTMTARQRAMLGHEIEGENELVELPTEIRRKDEDTEEAAKRRKQRAKKRKQQMEKQIEEDKAQTIEKLLNKQAKSRKEVEKQKRIQKAVIPRITYLNNNQGITISFPPNTKTPLQKQQTTYIPKAKEICVVDGCSNTKKYSCSKTKLPLCSLECYKKVQQTVIVSGMA